MAFDEKQVRELLVHNIFPNKLLNPKNGAIPHLIKLLGDQSLMKCVAIKSEIQYSLEAYCGDDVRVNNPYEMRPVSGQAFEALKLIGMKAVPALIESLSDENMDIRASSRSLIEFSLQNDFRQIRKQSEANRMLLEDVRRSLKAFVDRARSTHDKVVVEDAKNEAITAYLSIAGEVKNNKERILPDRGILSEGTIRPPSGSRKDGMFRSAADKRRRAIWGAE